MTPNSRRNACGRRVHATPLHTLSAALVLVGGVAATSAAQAQTPPPALLLEAEGDYDKFLGVVQKRYGDRKEELEQWVEDWHERNEILARKAAESRNQM